MSSPRPHDFYALGVRTPLVRALAARGIVEPFPIQAAALPDALAGRDVLGKGRTGSGKTVAFALPIVERLLASGSGREPGRPRALVLVPTRELAVQVADTVDYLAHAMKLRTMTVFGGVRYTGQLRKLERGVDVVVATPGRLEDLIDQGALSLDAVEVVVLDEADLMADMGFLPPVTRVLQGCPPGQRMLFSATLDGDVQGVVDAFLSDPLVHSVEEQEEVTDAVHYLFLVRTDNKFLVVKDLLAGGGRALAFARTKAGAERMASQLSEAGIPAVELHGNLRQAARQRNLSAFADGSVSVLVATDIAARGIHVDDIGLVLHIDPPNDPKAFLHRSGRTARAGNEGNVVTLATKNQNKAVRALMAQAKIKPIQAVVVPGDERIASVRAAQVALAPAGRSIFEPDPEDVVEDEVRQERPERSRAWGREPKPERRRPAGGAQRERDRTPSRPGERRQRDDEHPRREPKPHGPGARGPRPERHAERPEYRGRVEAGGSRGARPERTPRARQAFPEGFWGPEPWEMEEPPRRGHARAGKPVGRDAARETRRADAPRQAPREERRPRSDRDASRGRSEQPPAKTKNRWTQQDREKAAQSRAEGFGFTKGKSAGTKPGRPGKAGGTSGGKLAGKTGPAKGRAKAVASKDKGKRKPR